MPTTYTKAESDVVNLLLQAIKLWHPRLYWSETPIGVLMADNDKGEPLKAHGWPALATMRVVSPADRPTKKYAAELRIDAQNWSDMEEESRLALLDHELSHLIVIDSVSVPLDYKMGRPLWKFDRHGLPCLKINKGDWQGSDGFKAVCLRHGSMAHELKNAQSIMKASELATIGEWVPDPKHPFLAEYDGWEHWDEPKEFNDTRCERLTREMRASLLQRVR